MDEQRKWFPKDVIQYWEDSTMIIEMITKDIKYYINSVDKAVTIKKRQLQL